MAKYQLHQVVDLVDSNLQFEVELKFFLCPIEKIIPFVRIPCFDFNRSISIC